MALDTQPDSFDQAEQVPKEIEHIAAMENKVDEFTDEQLQHIAYDINTEIPQ